jgi:hypothetical protein
MSELTLLGCQPSGGEWGIGKDEDADDGNSYSDDTYTFEVSLWLLKV